MLVDLWFSILFDSHGRCCKHEVCRASIRSRQFNPFWPLIVSGAQSTFKRRVGRNAWTAGMDDWLMLRCPKRLIFWRLLSLVVTKKHVDTMKDPSHTPVSEGDQKKCGHHFRDNHYRSFFSALLYKKFKAIHWRMQARVTGPERQDKSGNQGCDGVMDVVDCGLQVERRP